MNYSNRGAAAMAEMSPYGRPAFADHGTKKSGWSNASYPMVGNEPYGNKSSHWGQAYPMVGFDPGTFLSENKVACALGAAVLAGSLAYYFGYR